MGNRIAILLIIIVLLSAACGDKNKDLLTGGKGGNATLHITPTHADSTLDSLMVYIKYAAKEPPTDNKYDDSTMAVKAGGSKPVASFSGLKKGDYYIFSMGYHGAPIFQNVRGGIPYKIEAETSYDLNLPLYQF